MLRAMRDGAKTGILKYFLLGALVLAGGGLVLSDVGGFFRGGVSRNLVAKGNGIEISTIQFDRTVRRLLARQGMAPDQAYQLGFIDQILNNEIQTRLITRAAMELGLQVGDETVMQQISRLAEPLSSEGVSKKDALQQILRAQGISESEFVTSIRQEMATSLLRGALLSASPVISMEEAAALYQFRNEKRTLQALYYQHDKITTIDAPTDEQLEAYYNANKTDFAIPETRDLTLAFLNQDMLADKVEISEDDLKKAYEESIASFEQPERRTIDQAVLSTEADANDVRARVEKGATLKNAAKEVTGKTDSYLGETAVKENGLLKEIAEPVFAAKEGDIIGPVQTALGWHVIVLKTILPPQTEPFESVRDRLRKDMLNDRLAEDLVETANMIDDRLASGEALEAVVAEIGLTTQTIKGINQAGFDSSKKDALKDMEGNRAQILEAGFDIQEGESAPVIDLGNGRYAIVHADDVTPLFYTPLTEVRDTLVKRWMSEQKSLMNRARAEDAFKSELALDDLAKAQKLTLQTFENLNRTEAPKSPLTPAALRDIYNAEKGTRLMLDGTDGFLVGTVTDITLPATDGNAAQKEIERIREETAEILPQEIYSRLINYLSEKYNVKINNRVLKEIYDSPEN